jgi:hypothetical protein
MRQICVGLRVPKWSRLSWWGGCTSSPVFGIELAAATVFDSEEERAMTSLLYLLWQCSYFTFHGIGADLQGQQRQR